MFKIQSVNPKTTAVLVIDMINDFVKKGYPMYFPQSDAIIPPMNSFLDSCRSRGMHVIFTTQTHRENNADMGHYGQLMDPIGAHTICKAGTKGAEITDEVPMKTDDMLIVKHNYSAFYGTELDVILRSLKIETVVVIGVCTEMCCAATAREAINRNYDVAFISDLTATFDYPDLGFGARSSDEIQSTVLSILRMTTCDVLTADEFLSIQG